MRATVNIHEAKTNFSKLVERAQNGETITIARAGCPVAELGPVSQRPARRPFGIDKGKVIIHDDFDDPLPEFEEYM